MSERKKIDRLFQENFRDFEVTPDEKVWQNIEAALKEKKKRRVIPIWWKVAGVAALLMLGLLIFNRFSNSGKTTHNEVVNTDGNTSGSENANSNQNATQNGSDENVQPSHPGSNIPNPKVANPSENASGSKLAPNASDNAVAASPSAGSLQKTLHERGINQPDPFGPKAGSAPRNRQKSSGSTNAINPSAGDAFATAPVRKASGHTNPEKPFAETPNQGVAANDNNKSGQGLLPANGSNESTTRQNNQNTNDKLEVQTPQNTGFAANDATIKKDSAAVATAEPNVLEELLNEKEDKVTSREQKINRWQITSNVAPIYFSSMSQGSPLDSRFEGNKKSYTPSVSYGVGAKYAINKKFSIKSGVNSVALEYNTTDVVFFQTENARMLENVKPTLAGSFIQVDNEPDQNAVTTLGRAAPNQYKGEVNQKIGYVEVPVEMSYQILDRKFGVEVIGGLSTLFLNRNEISLLAPGMNMNIGEANNLSTVHFSTNVGMGFRYSFLKSFQANVEPMFKYQINTFSNDAGNFKPFLFGVYTGVSFKF